MRTQQHLRDNFGDGPGGWRALTVPSDDRNAYPDTILELCIGIAISHTEQFPIFPVSAFLTRALGILSLAVLAKRKTAQGGLNRQTPTAPGREVTYRPWRC